MICENSYYPNNNEKLKPCCKSEQKLKDDLFGERCPLIYYCRISERFEQTADMFECKYRRKEDE